jgi:pimeloyl-ACP methyl ester carboxylesterase
MTPLLFAILALPPGQGAPHAEHAPAAPSTTPDTKHQTPNTSEVQTLFQKAAPEPGGHGTPQPRERAVVLIHGLGLHPLSHEKAVKPRLRSWQQPESALVHRLARDSDVYSLAYGQNASVEQIATSSDVPRHIRGLKSAGYREIVLVGHSAGGLIARHLAEDNPGLGITRVIQVCAPNAGSAWAGLKTARAAQGPFLASLTRSGRQKVLDERAGKRIPDGVAFACVVGSCGVGGDGIVQSRSQWSADLQAQGVPAFPLRTTHREAMTTARAAELLGRLVVEPLPRWDARKVVETRKALLGS